MSHLRIVGVNDVYTLDNLPGLATLIASLREDCDVLLVTVAGDFLAPSLLSSLDQGRGMVDCLNALGVTHVTLGNHEDDLPTGELLDRLEALDATVLLANVPDFVGPFVATDLVEVGDRQVGLYGVVNGNPSLYHRVPFGGATVGPTLAAALAATLALRGAGADAVVALTHQPLPDDRRLAATGTADLILGGHEHEGYLESDHPTLIIKAPMNALAAIVADVRILEDAVETTARFVPIASVEPEPAMAARVARLLEPVRAIEARTLLVLDAGTEVSSEGSRRRQTSLGSLVCSRMRDSLEADAGMLNGGALRGDTTYAGRLTYADFRTELPFDIEAVVVTLPGRVIQEALQYSRSQLAETGGFLQTDDALAVDSRHRITGIAGTPFDPDRTYRLALGRDLLMGIDDIVPFVVWARRHADQVPPRTTGLDLKVLLLRSFG